MMTNCPTSMGVPVPYRQDTRVHISILGFLAYLLERNIKFTITSALRTHEENEKAGGSPTSAHLLGNAIDIRGAVVSADSLKVICDAFFEYNNFIRGSYGLHLTYDQFIYYDTFVHIGYASHSRPRNQRLKSVNGKFIKLD